MQFTTVLRNLHTVVFEVSSFVGITLYIEIYNFRRAYKTVCILLWQGLGGEGRIGLMVKNLHVFLSCTSLILQ